MYLIFTEKPDPFNFFLYIFRIKSSFLFIFLISLYYGFVTFYWIFTYYDLIYMIRQNREHISEGKLLFSR